MAKKNQKNEQTVPAEQTTLQADVQGPQDPIAAALALIETGRKDVQARRTLAVERITALRAEAEALVSGINTQIREQHEALKALDAEAVRYGMPTLQADRAAGKTGTGKGIKADGQPRVCSVCGQSGHNSRNPTFHPATATEQVQTPQEQTPEQTADVSAN